MENEKTNTIFQMKMQLIALSETDRLMNEIDKNGVVWKAESKKTICYCRI